MVGRKLLIRKANKIARKKQNTACSITYREAENIGVIFTVGDIGKHSQIKSFISKLKEDKKKVEVMCFLPKGKENHEFIFNYFTDKDISFLGSFSNEEVIAFTNKKYDFLFCLDCAPDPLLESLMGMTEASCRVGCYRPEKDHFYELMIHPQELSTSELIKETLKYIKILR